MRVPLPQALNSDFGSLSFSSPRSAPNASFSKLGFSQGTQFRRKDGDGTAAGGSGAAPEDSHQTSFTTTLAESVGWRGLTQSLRDMVGAQEGIPLTAKRAVSLAQEKTTFALVRSIVEENGLTLKGFGEFRIVFQERANYSHPISTRPCEPRYRYRVSFLAAEQLKEAIQPENQVVSVQTWVPDRFLARLKDEFPLMGRRDLHTLAHSYVETIRSILAFGEKVKLNSSGLGSFEVVQRNQRHYRHPKTGELLPDRFSWRVEFRATRAFRVLVDRVGEVREAARVAAKVHYLAKDTLKEQDPWDPVQGTLAEYRAKLSQARSRRTKNLKHEE